ncbi:MAG: TIGR02301 family protein [Caulobacter sp. 12-67-6]|nr:MAG: TIGR02301 family protein [Caulobacter sp. 12-67-6]OYX70392.1 MAG: TIGR02301 family protein [Caulobacter sp. 32-67-35]OYX91985.1 MAG: TIGR02301 family protein [Caulobacter sp. 35-67-4]
MLRLPVAALIIACMATSALAQEREPEERQRLLDLAYTLGESHALRQTCEGVNDQLWRSRMVRLTEVEQADQGFDAQLRERFNTGFAARQGEFPLCDTASRKAEQQSARKGQALALKLSQSMRVVQRGETAPDSMAEIVAPR